MLVLDRVLVLAPSTLYIFKFLLVMENYHGTCQHVVHGSGL